MSYEGNISDASDEVAAKVFLSGFNNMNQARKEVKNIVTGIVDIYGAPITEWGRRCPNQFVRLGGGWTLASNGAGDWWIVAEDTVVFSTSNGYIELPRAFVMQARREIGAFIKGIMKMFPDNCVQISHVFDAADA